MITIRLYGILRKKFGKEFTFAGRTPSDAIRALCRLKKGFQQHLLDHSEPGYRVLVGSRELKKENLVEPVGGDIVKLIPAVAHNKAGVQLIVGVILVAVGLYTGQLWLAQIGGSLIMGGVSQMLAKTPSFAPTGMDKGPSDTPTYAFQGPHMTTGQGNCVPVGYGRTRIGGALISLGVSPETWVTNGFGGAASDEVGTQTGDGDTTPWVWAIAPA